jgi:ABC-type multidrug transport system ATPase subunit
VNWLVGPGDRIAVLGANGAGKTTLLRVLADLREPDGGRVVRGSTVRPAFLSQELRELPGDLRLLEAVEEVAKRVKLGDRELTAGQLAEVFGFTGARVWTPVADLSGGERRRLQMLRLLATEPNVLILDEPTNDLDIDTLAALEDLLDTWPGTLIVASHDRYLIERVTDNVFGMYGDGKLTNLPGGVDEYLAHVTDSPGFAATQAAERTAASTADRTPDLRASEKDAKAAKKELAKLERSMDRLAQKEETLHAQLAEHATDYAKITELDARLRAVQQEKAEIEEQWLALAEVSG